MIDGLKLTIAGEEIRKLIDERIGCHKRSIERWRRELARTPEEQTEENPGLPDHICENGIDEHEWRVEVLEFIRDHVEGPEVYRLAEADLAFGELLPEEPGWMQQSEYEERTGVAFNLERLTKEVRGLGYGNYALERSAAAVSSE